MFVLTYRQFPNVGLWFEHPYRRRDAWCEVPNLAMGVSRPLEVDRSGHKLNFILTAFYHQGSPKEQFACVFITLSTSRHCVSCS